MERKPNARHKPNARYRPNARPNYRRNQLVKNSETEEPEQPQIVPDAGVVPIDPCFDIKEQRCGAITIYSKNIDCDKCPNVLTRTSCNRVRKWFYNGNYIGAIGTAMPQSVTFFNPPSTTVLHDWFLRDVGRVTFVFKTRACMNHFLPQLDFPCLSIVSGRSIIADKLLSRLTSLSEFSYRRDAEIAYTSKSGFVTSERTLEIAAAKSHEHLIGIAEFVVENSVCTPFSIDEVCRFLTLAKFARFAKITLEWLTGTKHEMNRRLLALFTTTRWKGTELQIGFDLVCEDKMVLLQIKKYIDHRPLIPIDFDNERDLQYIDGLNGLKNDDENCDDEN